MIVVEVSTHAWIRKVVVEGNTRERSGRTRLDAVIYDCIQTWKLFTRR